MNNIKLNNGVEMPLIGLGTFPMKKLELIKTMRNAVKVGYRSFDTATAYENEKWVGYGIKLCGKKRKELFITTKISNRQQETSNVEESVNQSLKCLGLKYIDLYLMHWPNPETYIKTWLEMEEVYKKGLVKSIGVCNFHEHHLEKLLEIATIIPAVNQIELHPLLNQKELVNYCESKGIRVQAYTPLARMDKRLIDNEVIRNIAQKYNKSITQIILRWDYQNSIITIPKTSNKERLKENIDIYDFMLTKDEMKQINKLNINLRVRHNPDNCDFSKL